MDIDLAGRLNNQLDHIKEVVSTVCEVHVEPDGIAFNRTSIEVSRIKEDADYEVVRVQFHATLARARIPMQLDIGFRDVITPGPTDIEYPSLLDFPAPVLRAYPKETVVAEKLEALTALGLLNSRMKDFYDLGLLSRMYPFEGAGSSRHRSDRPQEADLRWHLARRLRCFSGNDRGGQGAGWVCGGRRLWNVQ
jgi:hypothetical protein